MPQSPSLQPVQLYSILPLLLRGLFLALFPPSLLYEQESSLQYSGNAVESLPIYIYLILGMPAPELPNEELK